MVGDSFEVFTIDETLDALLDHVDIRREPRRQLRKHF